MNRSSSLDRAPRSLASCAQAPRILSVNGDRPRSGLQYCTSRMRRFGTSDIDRIACVSMATKPMVRSVNHAMSVLDAKLARHCGFMQEILTILLNVLSKYPVLAKICQACRESNP